MRLEKAVLAVLTARDEVQTTLDDARSMSAEDVMALRQWDQKLREYSPTIATVPALDEWRSLLNPPESAWWWHFEPPSSMPWLEQKFKWLNRFDALWTFLTLFFLTISVTLLLNTLTRFVEGGLDSFGTLAVVMQALLTVVGGAAALTEQGRKWVESWLLRLRIPKSFWQECSTLVSLVVLILVFGIYQFGLPKVAQMLHEQGRITHYQRNHFDSAQQFYRKAIALHPDFARAHYDLGILSEDLQQLETATEQYQIVVQSNLDELDLLTKLRAHNNLGRIYIIKERYREAWPPLEFALTFVEEKDQTDLKNPNVVWEQIELEHYNILSNLGRLRIGQEHFLEANDYLLEAIDIGKGLGEKLKIYPKLREKLERNGEPGAAYCLEAQALEGLGRDAEALDFWTNCLRYGVLNDPDEAKWLAVAQERWSGIVPTEEAE